MHSQTYDESTSDHSLPGVVFVIEIFFGLLFVLEVPQGNVVSTNVNLTTRVGLVSHQVVAYEEKST